jgi:putative tricarboxylic transport membrane protein
MPDRNPRLRGAGSATPVSFPPGAMPPSDIEIAVDDPREPDDASPAVTSVRTAEIVIYCVLLAFALLLGDDNWKSGIGWANGAPQSGYLPFYLCVILAAAALWGLGTTFTRRAALQRTFVTRAQLRRVSQVFIPALLFCAAMQWLGLYVSSLLLVAGFMRYVGRIAWWKSIATSVIFVVAMFVTFEIAFDVIMPKGPIEALFGY